MRLDRNKAVPSSYLILKKGNQILLGHRINTGYYDGYWALPAGHVEADELPLEALAREAKEEIRLVFDPKHAKLVHTMYRAKMDETGQRVDLFFVVETWAGEPINIELNKCSELVWFSLDDLPEKVMDHVRYALKCYQKGIVYSELPFDKKFLNPNAKK